MKNIVIAVLVVIALGLGYTALNGGVSFGASPASGPAHTQLESFWQGIMIGQRATVVKNVLSGTCNAVQKSPGSHAASSSMQYYCAVPGVLTGDRVFINLPVGAGANANGAGSIYGGFNAHTGNATSSNFIQFSIENFTGAATSSFAQATTGIQYWVPRVSN